MSMSTVRSVRHPAAPARCFRSAITQGLRTRRAVSSAAVDTVQPTAVATPPITLTDKALSHLKKLKSENANPGSLLLRVGVKQGGCSGMSYLMDFEERDKVSADDMVAQYDQGNLELVIDPKSEQGKGPGWAWGWGWALSHAWVASSTCGVHQQASLCRGAMRARASSAGAGCS
ncbi:iron-sulfur cluster assembly protein [Haematococcus lacustris]|uniref:Iron-sulfur cluster assembly protein n=1 Tax=Haematococcus lacustris TaxID=44745 RepID=A0A6A0AAM9_HAELA|nr:iron-sulfur cluster assembly protein [Haematococcus lacustris]